MALDDGGRGKGQVIQEHTVPKRGGMLFYQEKNGMRQYSFLKGYSGHSQETKWER